MPRLKKRALYMKKEWERKREESSDNPTTTTTETMDSTTITTITSTPSTATTSTSSVPVPFPIQADSSRADSSRTELICSSPAEHPSCTSTPIKPKSALSDRSLEKVLFTPPHPISPVGRVIPDKPTNITEKNAQPSTSGVVKKKKIRRFLYFEDLDKLEKENLLFSEEDLGEDLGEQLSAVVDRSFFEGDSDVDSLQLSDEESSDRFTQISPPPPQSPTRGHDPTPATSCVRLSEPKQYSDSNVPLQAFPTSSPPTGAPISQPVSIPIRWTSIEAMTEDVGSMRYELESKETEKPNEKTKLAPAAQRIKLMESSIFDIHPNIETDKKQETFLVEKKQLNKLIKTALICPDCEGNKIEIRSTEMKRDRFLPLLHVYCLECKKMKGTRCKSSSLSKLENEQHFDFKNVSTITLQFVLGAVTTGIGYTAASNLLTHMNIQAPSHTMYHKIRNGISNVINDRMDHLKDCTSRVIREYHMSKGKQLDEDNMMRITVSFDGSWLTRGHASLVGVAFVVDSETGLIIDAHVSNKHCQTCKINKSNKTKEEFLRWQITHRDEGKCQMTFDPTKSSGSMEAEAAIVLFGRSEKLGLRYMTIVSDEDSSTYKRLIESDPYKGINIKKLNCLNHISKKIYSKLEKVRIGERLDGKGKGKLTQHVEKFIANTYRKSIKSHVHDHESIRKAVAATFLHHISTDQKPLHKMCHTKYCDYKKSIIEGITPEPGWHQNNRKYCLYEKAKGHVFEVLKEATSDKVLEMVSEKTQNINESLHSKLWGTLSKDRFVGGQLVMLKVAQTYMQHNFGIVNAGMIYHHLLGLPFTKTLKKSSQKKQARTILRSVPRNVRRKRKAAKAKESDYGAGMF